MSYSAIIVLGNLMDKNGNLNIESSLRMDYAIDCFNSQEYPLLITCGWAYRPDSSITIADAMKTYAIKEGNISPDSIISETKSRDTVGDAIFTKINIISKKIWNKILIITSDYHKARTYEIFTYVYGENYTIDVRGIKTNRTDAHIKNEKISTDAFHQTFLGVKAGDIESIYKCLCIKHPFYNGDIYPII
tara:strand:+ start:434 stop:1003 length:570 start_codon:yes stop_codon:yes gene_type:complete